MYLPCIHTYYFLTEKISIDIVQEYFKIEGAKLDMTYLLFKKQFSAVCKSKNLLLFVNMIKSTPISDCFNSTICTQIPSLLTANINDSYECKHGIAFAIGKSKGSIV